MDEILRIPSTRLLVNLRGNKPLILDKVLYTEHSLYSKLKDSPISDYTPKWTKNIPKKEQIKNKPKEYPKEKKEKLSWDNF